MSSNSCLIIAGEKSGEEHCLTFFKELVASCPEQSFWGVGGDEMTKLGFESLYHLKDFSSWGFSEVIGKIPFYFKALKRIEKEVEKRNCKTAVLIDFQDFNLRLAMKLAKKGVKILYYVAPQAWVWKAGRAKKIEKCAHTLFTILPFEKKWFSDRGVKNIIGIDHPLLLSHKEDLKSLQKKKTFDEVQKKVNLLLLPGSRNAEVKGLLKDYFETVQKLKNTGINVEVSIVLASNVNENLYDPYLKYIDRIFEDGQLAEALKDADLALAASGTVTLSCALFGVPTIVCYTSSLLNEFIYYNLLSYRWFVSLANIVHEKEIFPELLQERSSSANMFRELTKIINNKDIYNDRILELGKTPNLVRGDLENVSSYMAKVIKGESVEA